jgi:2,3-bisphosphoglycerate-independent phosphoglycerate mutase
VAAPATERRVVLVVLDGWGHSETYEGNAIAQARTPHFDHLWKSYPHTLLQAAGESVGLPWGEMGNSEVGHVNIGAGHTVPQDLPRISAAINDESFYQNEALVAACQHAVTTGGCLHLIGLASSGGIHSHIRHLYALVHLAKRLGVTKLAIHAFTDGRDAPTKAGLGQIEKLDAELKATGLGQIATVCGRYFAMDRDNHWDRVKLAYDAIALGKGPTAPSAEAAVEQAYKAEQTDEFITPTVIVDETGQPKATIADEDAAIFFNFRPDRVRQLTRSFVESEFDQFDRGPAPVGLHFVTMTQYEPTLPVHVAFHPQNVKHALAEVLSDAGLRQFHIAETEKYPHATFFLNGGREKPYPLEERLMVPSPAVATYDLEPAMSAAKITDELIRKIEAKEYALIMANYANADMVGHSGNMEATIQAVQAVDAELGRLAEVCAANDAFLVITADHGNAEQMVDFASGQIDTEHTTNPVPFIVVPPPGQEDVVPINTGKLAMEPSTVPTGILGDVAPTVLAILDVASPEEMAGYGLL